VLSAVRDEKAKPYLKVMEESPRDPHPWRGALSLGGISVAVLMGLSLSLEWVVPPARGWAFPGDVWYFVRAARYVGNGALGYMYEASDLIYALPLFPILLSPLVVLGDALGLAEPLPFPLIRPTMWLLVGPFGMSSVIVLMHAIRAVAYRMSLPGSHVSTQVWTAALILLPASIYGHFEDVLALAFVLLSLRSLLNRRPEAAALLLGVAIGFKQWAVLGLPLLIALTPSRSRLRSLGLALVLPVALGGFALIVDWEHAAPALLASPTFPELIGHAMPWIDPSSPTASPTLYRLMSLGLSVAIAVKLRDEREPRLIAAGFAVVFLSRALLEPVPLSYYLAPAFGFLLLYDRLSGRRLRNTGLLGCALIAYSLLPSDEPLWWIVFVAAGCFLAWSPVRALLRDRGTFRPPADARATVST
jgi:hypothetical protein